MTAGEHGGGHEMHPQGGGEDAPAVVPEGVPTRVGPWAPLCFEK